MKTAILMAAAAMCSVSFAQTPTFDNSKLLSLIGDWEGTAAMNDAGPTASTIKGTKLLKDNWIRLDLKFTIEEVGPAEAVAMLCADEDGTVEGHFFASFSPNGLIGKGKVVDKKLTLNVTTLAGVETMVFVFDMSVADELKFKVSAPEAAEPAHISGSYKRKK